MPPTNQDDRPQDPEDLLVSVMLPRSSIAGLHFAVSYVLGLMENDPNRPDIMEVGELPEDATPEETLQYRAMKQCVDTGKALQSEVTNAVRKAADAFESAARSAFTDENNPVVAAEQKTEALGSALERLGSLVGDTGEDDTEGLNDGESAVAMSLILTFEHFRDQVGAHSEGMRRMLEHLEFHTATCRKSECVRMTDLQRCALQMNESVVARFNTALDELRDSVSDDPSYVAAKELNERINTLKRETVEAQRSEGYNPCPISDILVQPPNGPVS